jgi:F-type H+-transporting ATPase subunit b
MKNLITASILLSNDGFTLNTDILETNLINIVLLVAILFKVVGDALKASLINRRQKIINDVNDAEKRLVNAKERLSEANTSLIDSRIQALFCLDKKIDMISSQILGKIFI